MQVVHESAAELIYRTTAFPRAAAKRLDEDLGGRHRNVERHFGGQHVYWDEVQRNVRHAEAIAAEKDLGYCAGSRRCLSRTVTREPYRACAEFQQEGQRFAGLLVLPFTVHRSR